MRNTNTCFGRLLAYLDTVAPGELVHRKDLLYVVYGKSAGISRSTVDKWRRQLTVLGYLQETFRPGIYTRGLSVPKDLTTSKLEELYTKELYKKN